LCVLSYITMLVLRGSLCVLSYITMLVLRGSLCVLSYITMPGHAFVLNYVYDWALILHNKILIDIFVSCLSLMYYDRCATLLQ
jgi:hypothetical protein